MTSLRDSLDPVLRATGVRRTDSFDRALGRLVDYFRRFRDAPLTEQAGDNRYLTLALGGVGACRHRAYAFVLTLQGLGVPARYVGNEAHAWAEVALPGVGWSRVDLGGWDVPMQATAPSARDRWTPRGHAPIVCDGAGDRPEAACSDVLLTCRITIGDGPTDRKKTRRPLRRSRRVLRPRHRERVRDCRRRSPDSPR